ncbi:delta-aminolevulinic acid dehydratase [Planctomycetota bacterium]
MNNCADCLEALQEWTESRDFAGWDPYDALNSPLARALSFGTKYGRIAWIQLLKRMPLNLRPLLLVPKGQNPKGLGLFLWAYAKLYRVEQRAEYLTRIHHLLDRLKKLQSKGYSGNCWGYNFDWQSRAFFVPKYTPTIVNSSFIGHALLDTYHHTGIPEALDMARSIQDFLLADLHRTPDEDAFCFSYTPLDRTTVHNANLLGASLLIRLHALSGDPTARDAALAALAYTMNRQRHDGSWHYADTAMQSWIDSFHTGFNLQSLRYFLEAREALQYRPGYERGVRFYAENFFLADGTPKYYHDRTYPVDIHSAAQAIVFFSREPAYRALVEKVLQWTFVNLLDRRGYFYFQKHRFYTNRICYMRWAQAWAFHALSEYYLHVSERVTDERDQESPSTEYTG